MTARAQNVELEAHGRRWSFDDVFVQPCRHCTSQVMAVAVYRIDGGETLVANPTVYAHGEHGWLLALEPVEGGERFVFVLEPDELRAWKS